MTLHVEGWARVHMSAQSCEHVAVSRPNGKLGPSPQVLAGRSSLRIPHTVTGRPWMSTFWEF